MIYRVAIVEDDFDSMAKIKNHIKKYAKEMQEEFEIFTFEDGDEIASDYEGKYDIIFLDIEMKRMDGMSAAKLIRKFDREVIVIFITNTPQYAIKGYEVEALSYLLKPVPYFAFSQEMEKAIKRINKHKNKFILLKTDEGTIRLNVFDIYYIETMKHYLYIHSKSGVHKMKATLKKMATELMDYHFSMCNSCYLVNLDEVEGVNKDFVVINGDELKISRPKKKAFMEELASHFGGKL